MSTSPSRERPAFNQLNEAEVVEDRPPMSFMAVVAFLVGLLSLVAPFTFKLLPLSFVAMAIGGMVSWRLSCDSSLGGGRWSLAGLGLGAISTAWCLTASVTTSNYMYSLAADHAKVYLDTIANGDMYEALELHVMKTERQIAGTDLEAHYTSKTGEKADLALEIINSDAIKAVREIGPRAEWKLLKGLDINTIGPVNTVHLEMANNINPIKVIGLTMTRRFFLDEAGQRISWWNVERVNVRDEFGTVSSLTTAPSAKL